MVNKPHIPEETQVHTRWEAYNNPPRLISIEDRPPHVTEDILGITVLLFDKLRPGIVVLLFDAIVILTYLFPQVAKLIEYWLPFGWDYHVTNILVEVLRLSLHS